MSKRSLVGRRGGFGLVEVVVAMSLVAVGVMSVGAGAAFSTRLLRTSENHEDAARIAEALLDSIAYAPMHEDGTLSEGRFDARWEADNATVHVTIRQRDTGEDVLGILAVIAPVLDTLPCALCDE